MGRCVDSRLVVAGLVFVCLVGSVVLVLRGDITTNFLPTEQDEGRTGQPVDPETPTLVFTAEQATAFNDVYRRRDREWSWCMNIEGGNVTEVSHPINTSTTHESVRYWCQGETDGTVHTHPSGTPALSHADRLSNYPFSCLVYDRVPERWFENPSGLDCYRHLEGDRVEEIDVLIQPRR